MGIFLMVFWIASVSLENLCQYMAKTRKTPLRDYLISQLKSVMKLFPSTTHSLVKHSAMITMFYKPTFCFWQFFLQTLQGFTSRCTNSTRHTSFQPRTLVGTLCFFQLKPSWVCWMVLINYCFSNGLYVAESMELVKFDTLQLTLCC